MDGRGSREGRSAGSRSSGWRRTGSAGSPAARREARACGVTTAGTRRRPIPGIPALPSSRNAKSSSGATGRWRRSPARDRARRAQRPRAFCPRAVPDLAVRDGGVLDRALSLPRARTAPSPSRDISTAGLAPSTAGAPAPARRRTSSVSVAARRHRDPGGCRLDRLASEPRSPLRARGRRELRGRVEVRAGRAALSGRRGRSLGTRRLELDPRGGTGGVPRLFLRGGLDGSGAALRSRAPAKGAPADRRPAARRARSPRRSLSRGRRQPGRLDRGRIPGGATGGAGQHGFPAGAHARHRALRRSRPSGQRRGGAACRADCTRPAAAPEFSSSDGPLWFVLAVEWFTRLRRDPSPPHAAAGRGPLRPLLLPEGGAARRLRRTGRAGERILRASR